MDRWLLHRYQDIAKLALSVRQRPESGALRGPSKAGQEPDVMLQVAQELYRVVLFAVFMAQTYIAGLIPGVGALPACPGPVAPCLRCLHGFSLVFCKTFSLESTSSDVPHKARQASAPEHVSYGQVGAC